MVKKSQEPLKNLKKRIAKSDPSKYLPNPFSITFTKVSNVYKIPIRKLAKKYKKDQSVKLILISLPKIENLTPKQTCELNPRLRTVDVDSCWRVLCNYPESFAEKLLHLFKKTINIALNNFDADIICINELGMPFPKHLKYWRKARDFARKKANENNCVILAGTTHDHRTHNNSAQIFYPGSDVCGTWYHKQVSAQQLKPHPELVSIPPKRISYTTDVFGLKIAFLTCLDIADYSSVAPIVGLNEFINVLIVPSYSPWTESLEKASITISEAISGGVALVNHYMGTVRPSSYLYMYGEEDPREADDQKYSKNEKWKMSLHLLDPDELNDKKISMREDLNPNIKWLFRLEDFLPK